MISILLPLLLLVVSAEARRGGGGGGGGGGDGDGGSSSSSKTVSYQTYRSFCRAEQLQIDVERPLASQGHVWRLHSLGCLFLGSIILFSQENTKHTLMEGTHTLPDTVACDRPHCNRICSFCLLGEGVNRYRLGAAQLTQYFHHSPLLFQLLLSCWRGSLHRPATCCFPS